MKRFITILTAGTVFLHLPVFPLQLSVSAEPVSGKCGDNIVYTLENGILTLTGTGPTYDYNYEPDLEEFMERYQNSPHPEEEMKPLAPVPWENQGEPVTAIIVGEGITRLGNYLCFDGALETAALPDSLLEIGSCTFRGCPLRELVLPPKLQTIGNAAFMDTAIENALTIPASVSSIGGRCFQGVPLQSLTFTESETALTIADSAFLQSGITSLHIPANVTEIGNCAFESTALLEVSFAESEKPLEIGLQAFENCKKLCSISLSKRFRLLPESCFAFNESLTEISIPEGCEEIGMYCFEGCKSLQTAVLPDGLKTVGEFAFAGCTNLSRAVLPDSLETIAQAAFTDSSLTGVKIPPRVTELPSYAFRGTAVSHLSIPETVERIGKECFSRSKLKSVVLPDTEIQLGSDCFADCTALDSVHLSAKCTYLPARAFSGCTALRSIVIPGGCAEIGSGCFSGCSLLDSVTLPDTVERIDRYAFSECGKLTSLKFPEKLARIEKEAFRNASVREVILPDSIRYIGESAFLTCRTETLTLPQHFIEIEENALPELWLQKQGDFVTVADGQLYRYQGADTDVKVPAGVRRIMPGTFVPNTVLRSGPECVTLSDTAEVIEKAAFRGCDALKTLEIPRSVILIDDSAVRSCPNLTTIRGDYYSQAQGMALRMKLTFEPLHADEIGETVRPETETENFSFGNYADVFGSEYYLSPWKKALLFENSDTVPYMQGKIQEAWNGSCYGLSVVTVLVRNGIIPLSALDPEAASLADVRPTQQVQDLINYYHFSQYLKNGSSNEGNTEFMYLLRAATAALDVNRGASPFVLAVTTQSGGGHAVVGYGLEAGDWNYDGRHYTRRILIWDSNYAGAFSADCCLYFNPETLEWTIPVYGIGCWPSQKKAVGSLTGVKQDPAALNRFPGTEEQRPGDVDRDRKLSAADAVLLARFIAEDASLSPAGCCNADADGNGILNVADVFAVLRNITA